MTYRRLAIAAGLFLLATYLKLFLPAYETSIEPRLWDMMDRETLTLPAPAEAAAWLAWD